VSAETAIPVARRSLVRSIASHAVLGVFSALALAPVLLIVMNAFKSRKAIFQSPLAPPGPDTFDLIGFTSVLTEGNFLSYFGNSLIVTLAALAGTILFGAMAAFALSEYRFRLNALTFLFLTLGLMIPIRLGTVGILEMMVRLSLVNTRTALVLVYVAQGLPMAVFILVEFMRTVSTDLKNAARVDGLNEYEIFIWLVLPLLRPAMVTVAVFTMIPIWNDLWFPLILAPGEETKTLTLGTQVFIGQYVTNWNSVLAALSLSILPILALYLLFSRGLIRGITSGAVK
jgi:raffinose/stachyose/melibiose transport system permease protein